MQKIWNIKKYDTKYLEEIKEKYGISTIMAKLIVSRDIAFNEIDGFLNGDISLLDDAFKMKDMDKFVQRVILAIEKKEKVCIYGDYDVDGITSIAIMYKFLKDENVDVSYYLPDRLLEGYGINKNALNLIKDRGTTLVITVDCGITAIDEIEYAKSIGLDVCITDHHECSDEIPKCIAIVNPKQKDDKYPFKMHAGVGVAFKCITAICKTLGRDDETFMKYIDIVAIGTISDIVPLVNENRIISKYGLKQIEVTQNVGLKALLKVVPSKEIDSQMVSFAIAPRINACGRMGDASLAVELLLQHDEKTALLLAKKLDKLNITRQAIEKKIFDETIAMIKEQELDKKSSIILYNENWHNGVIGIVASRLVNLYFKPVILFTKEQETIRGSGRCQAGFSLYDALTECKEYLSQFGGHELAAGMSIEYENIKPFIESFEQVVKKKLNNVAQQVIDIDTEIKREDLNINTLRDIRKLKPYGQSNKTPLFLYKGLRVSAIRTIKDEKHLKLTLQDNKNLLEAMAFSQGSRRDEITIGDKINVICNIELNTFNMQNNVLLIVQDFQKAVE